MATTIIQKFGGPTPTVALPITPPALNPSDTRPIQDRLVDQQWRDAARQGLGQTHPGAINTDTSYA